MWWFFEIWKKRGLTWIIEIPKNINFKIRLKCAFTDLHMSLYFSIPPFIYSAYLSTPSIHPSIHPSILSPIYTVLIKLHLIFSFFLTNELFKVLNVKAESALHEYILSHGPTLFVWFVTHSLLCTRDFPGKHARVG